MKTNYLEIYQDRTSMTEAFVYAVKFTLSTHCRIRWLDANPEMTRNERDALLYLDISEEGKHSKKNVWSLRG